MSKKMGDAALQTVKTEKETISRIHAISTAFREISESIFKEKDCRKFMEKFRKIMCSLIEQKRPLSDDMLLIAWNNTKEQPNIWKSLKKASESILRIPINKKDFVWFNSYLLKSAVPYFSLSLSLCALCLLVCLCVLRWRDDVPFSMHLSDSIGQTPSPPCLSLSPSLWIGMVCERKQAIEFKVPRFIGSGFPGRKR